MESERVFYRSSFNVFEFMLKGESMKFGCNQSGSCSFKFLVYSQSRYQPAKIAVSSVNNRKYLKLYNGDIYCVETNTILNRHTLLELMENLH